MRTRPGPPRALLVLAIALVPGAWLISEPRGVYRGVSVLGTSVEGMDLRTTRATCATLAGHAKSQPLRITAGGRVAEATPGQLGAEYVVEAAAARAWLVGRQLSLWRRLCSRVAAWRGVDVGIPVQIKEERLARYAKRLETPPRNASLRLVGVVVSVVPDRPGISISVEDAAMVVEGTLARGQASVMLPHWTRPASVRAKDLVGVNRVLTTVTVPITSTDPKARRNAELAAASVNGVVVLPGDTLSMNRVLGQRTRAKGYLPASVLINQKRDVALGGGICTTSTAVFMAALQAGLEIPERHAHSKLPRHALPGLDATLDYGTDKDLRVRNTTPFPVAFMAVVTGSQVQVAVVGGPLRARHIQISTAVVSKDGYTKATTYRTMEGIRALVCTSRYARSRSVTTGRPTSAAEARSRRRANG